MNSLFTRQKDAFAEPETPVSTAVRGENGSIEWILKPAARKVSPELTADDRRELFLCNPPLMNMEVASKAKVVYAAGGRTKDIQRVCNISPDYAKKIHAAFGRSRAAIAKKCIVNQ